MKRKARYKIFLVEDNFLYRYVLEKILSDSANYSITSFDSGEECVEMLSNNPDLIILDHGLKGMSGLETLRSIRKSLPAVPVIVLSGQQSVQVAADFFSEGATDYMEKRNNDSASKELKSSITRLLN
jgi:CheY-like chemotaxis protein